MIANDDVVCSIQEIWQSGLWYLRNEAGNMGGGEEHTGRLSVFFEGAGDRSGQTAYMGTLVE